MDINIKNDLQEVVYIATIDGGYMMVGLLMGVMIGLVIWVVLANLEGF